MLKERNKVTSNTALSTELELLARPAIDFSSSNTAFMRDLLATGTTLRVGLHDADREDKLVSTNHLKRNAADFPNFALCKIAAYHKSRGDVVEWWDANKHYNIVYSSKVFTWTPENPLLPPDTIKGGSGYDLTTKLPPEIDESQPDFSIYEDWDGYSMGFLTRGCIRNNETCPHCLVPIKEGKITPYRTWQEIMLQGSTKLRLLDNNLLGCSYGISQLAELAETNIEVDCNQGLDARIVAKPGNEYIVDILSRVKWMRKVYKRVDKKTGKVKTVKGTANIRFACDSMAQIASIQRTAELLLAKGVKPYRMLVYLLVDDIADAELRVQELKKIGVKLYAQAFRPLDGSNPTPAQKRFARSYVNGRAYGNRTWVEYCEQYGLDPYDPMLAKISKGTFTRKAGV